MEALLGLEPAGPASVLGWDLGLSPTGAALLNGTFIQGFELDDYHELGPLHSASVVLPAAFATAQALSRPVSGEELALAVALGFEVGPRLGTAMRGHAMLGHGWHSGAVYGGLAAAVAAGSLRRLDAVGFEDALGIAATQAGGLMSAQFDSMVKRMNHAFGARNGVLAAALAEAGFTGIRDVLERPYGGLFTMFAGDHPIDPGAVTEGLGERFELEAILVKPYASGGSTHPVADALLLARDERGVTAARLKALTIRLGHSSFNHNGWRLERPLSPVAAQLNVAYVAAVALLDGAVFVAQFSPARMDADDVWSVIERTTVVEDPDVEELGRRSGTPRAARVSCELTDGSTVDIEVLEARGTKQRALSNAEVRAKFHDLLDDLIGAGRAGEIEARTLGLCELASAEELIGLLAEAVPAII